MSFTPTLGQVVAYKLTTTDSPLSAGLTRPAIVLTYNADSTVNLKVFMDDGVDYSGPLCNPPAVLYRSEVAQGTANGNYNAFSGALPYSVYAAGTAYALTATNAPVVFGTTSPVLVLATAGTYNLTGQVTVNYVGATFAANQTVTVELYRTNNTPGAIANTSAAVVTGIVTTITGTLAVITLPTVAYTTLVGTDSITIYGIVTVIPSAGTIVIASASIIATPVA